METRQANFLLPVELLRELRARVPRGEQSRVVAEALRYELQRRRLREAIEQAYGAWANNPHPELAAGTEKYIRRSRSSTRIQRTTGRK